ncbi:MAG: Omp28-related outer membrane protein [Candidatus Onthomorpha sp.]
MKRIVLLVSGLLLSAFSLTAQTPQFVSTEPANRNVVIEEFTGVNCGFCPDGHRIVREYQEANPGRVFAINIHQGGYAALYTTQWGNALNNQTGMAGSYPSGTINRHVFSGGITGLSRADFASCGNQIKEMPSFVNVAAQASIDAATRTLTVNVEVYYTGDAETGSNYLNVALLQDSVIGPQSGGSNFNPTQVTADGQYIHMHMLRDLLTGQWGEELTVEGSAVIPQGTLFQKTYTYTIPAHMSDALVKLSQLHLVVFVTRDHQEIYTGASCKPVVSNIPQLGAMSMGATAENIYGCTEEVIPYISVMNLGETPITAMEIEYSSSLSAAQTFNWTGNLAFEQTEKIQLPNVLANVGSATEVSAKILTINSNPINDDLKTASVTKKAAAEGNGDKLKIIIKTDQFASEAAWKLYGPDGSVIKQKSYTGNSSVKDTVIVDLTETGCYVYEVTDDFGDGGTKHQVYDGSGLRLVNGTASSYGTIAQYDMKILSLVGLEEAEGVILQTLVYPNPAKDRVNLEISMLQATKANISVVDMLGREVIKLGDVSLASGNNLVEINTSALSNGAYFVKIMSNDGITSKKISINR